MINAVYHLSLIDTEKNSFHSFPSNAEHRCEMGIRRPRNNSECNKELTNFGS